MCPAAMRLRQLGTTQSIMFFAPPEVHQSILDVCMKNHWEYVNSSHVVRWLLEQTCRGNEQLQMLYTGQGSEFCLRMNAAWEHSDFLVNKNHRSALLSTIESPERLTLEELYGVGTGSQWKDLQGVSHPGLRDIVNELKKQRGTAESRVLSFCHSAMDEVEQEREVEFQVEETREVQKSGHRKALEFSDLHPEISRFVDTGILSGEQASKQAFSFLSGTSLGMRYGLSAREARLLLSTEFMRTVESRSVDPDVEFLVRFAHSDRNQANTLHRGLSSMSCGALRQRLR